MSESKNIFQRLAEVRNGAKYIQKDKEVQGYMVVTHDMVTAHVRPLLDEAGILTLQTLLDSQVENSGMVTSKGAPIIRYSARYKIWFINIDMPEDRVDIDVEAHANDTGDKAPGKAMSYAMKYAFLKTFNIETGEAEEARVVGEAPTLTPEQILELRTMAEELGAKEPDVTLQYMATKAFGQEKIEDVRADMFERAQALLQAQAEKVRSDATNVSRSLNESGE